MSGGRYTITTHRRMEGVALAKAGHFGGLRFANYEEAESAAREDAKGGPMTIERETVR